jgi:hypothetical protein
MTQIGQGRGHGHGHGFSATRAASTFASRSARSARFGARNEGSVRIQARARARARIRLECGRAINRHLFTSRGSRREVSDVIGRLLPVGASEQLDRAGIGTVPPEHDLTREPRRLHFRNLRVEARFFRSSGAGCGEIAPGCDRALASKHRPRLTRGMSGGYRGEVTQVRTVPLDAIRTDRRRTAPGASRASPTKERPTSLRPPSRHTTFGVEHVPQHAASCSRRSRSRSRMRRAASSSLPPWRTAFVVAPS